MKTLPLHGSESGSIPLLGTISSDQLKEFDLTFSIEEKIERRREQKHQYRLKNIEKIREKAKIRYQARKNDPAQYAKMREYDRNRRYKLYHESAEYREKQIVWSSNYQKRMYSTSEEYRQLKAWQHKNKSQDSRGRPRSEIIT